MEESRTPTEKQSELTHLSDSDFNFFVYLKLFRKCNIEKDYGTQWKRRFYQSSGFTVVMFNKNFETHTKKAKLLKRVDSDCFSVSVLGSSA